MPTLGEGTPKAGCALLEPQVLAPPGPVTSALARRAASTICEVGDSAKINLTPSPYSLTPRNRKALAMTDTLDRLIAAAAIIGDIKSPVTGYRIPAATGMPMAL